MQLKREEDMSNINKLILLTSEQKMKELGVLLYSAIMRFYIREKQRGDKNSLDF